MQEILKVVWQGEPCQVIMKNGEVLKKSCIVLQRPGGEHEESFVATMFGNLAGCRFRPGELVLAVLHFTHHEYNESMFQDVIARDIINLTN